MLAARRILPVSVPFLTEPNVSSPLKPLTLYCLLAIVCCCLFRPATALATGDSLYFLLPTDSVVLYQQPGSDYLLFDHYLAEKQTLYGCAKFYGLTMDEVYNLNPRLRAGYEPGTKVTVPIPKKSLQPSFSRDSINWFVPVRYELRRGETLYGLTRRTLGHPNDSLLVGLNPGLSANTMTPGQLLNIGYLKLTGVPDTAQVEVEDPYVRRNRGMRELWDTRTQGKRMKSSNGKAAWTSKGDQNRFMCLHRTAPKGSLVEIDDPRSRKIIYATCIGPVPTKYDQSIVVVVSPLLVKAFGVRDRNFYVRTRHF